MPVGQRVEEDSEPLVVRVETVPIEPRCEVQQRLRAPRAHMRFVAVFRLWQLEETGRGEGAHLWSA